MTSETPSRGSPAPVGGAPPAGPTPPRGRRLLGATALWAAAVAVGFVVVGRYDATPGEVAAAPSVWPAGSALPRAPAGTSTLVLFAHPHCPCTRATLGELEILLARGGERVEATVVFVRPPGVEADWERTALWKRAEAIPGVRVRVDAGGAEAARFGARTSGHAFLFGPAGTLAFSGGITASRGHAGDNAGRSAIESILAGRDGAVSDTPVYGCRLLLGACDGESSSCKR